MQIPTLETERLILRPLTIADAPAVFEWVSDPIVTKFMPYNTYTRIEDVEEWLRSVEVETVIYNFAFVRKSDGKVIGSGSVNPKEGKTWEFGYNIRHDCWNQGYVTEATREMVRFARDEMGAARFVAGHAEDNPASGRVMEKCGLHFDHMGEYSSFDGLRTFRAKFYIGTASDTRDAGIAIKPPTLETDRLILRAPKAADAPDVFEWVSDPIVTKFMPYNTYTQVEDVENWLRAVETETSGYNFAFVRKSDGKVIGSGEIGPDDDGIHWGFGYNIRRDCWNQGYATEATRAMIAFARDKRGAAAFTANHAADNPASGRVMEKCGLHFDHWGEYSSFDGLRTFRAKFYTGTAENTLR